jgi:hypothetical protein
MENPKQLNEVRHEQAAAAAQASVATFEIPERPNLAKVADFETDPHAWVLASTAISRFRRTLHVLSTDNPHLFHQLEENQRARILSDIDWATSEAEALSREMKRLTDERRKSQHWSGCVMRRVNKEHKDFEKMPPENELVMLSLPVTMQSLPALVVDHLKPGRSPVVENKDFLSAWAVLEICDAETVGLRIDYPMDYPFRPPTMTLEPELCSNFQALQQQMDLVCPELKDWRSGTSMTVLRGHFANCRWTDCGQWTPSVSIPNTLRFIAARLTDLSLPEAADDIVRLSGSPEQGCDSTVHVEFGTAGQPLPMPSGPRPDGTRMTELFISIDPHFCGPFTFAHTTQEISWKTAEARAQRNRGLLSWRVSDAELGIDARYVVLSAPYCGDHHDSAEALARILMRLRDELGWRRFSFYYQTDITLPAALEEAGIVPPGYCVARLYQEKRPVVANPDLRTRIEEIAVRAVPHNWLHLSGGCGTTVGSWKQPPILSKFLNAPLQVSLSLSLSLFSLSLSFSFFRSLTVCLCVYDCFRLLQFPPCHSRTLPLLPPWPAPVFSLPHLPLFVSLTVVTWFT